VQCVFAGDLDAVPATSAHLAFRVVQEGLTNALRHAPGAAVRVRVEALDGAVRVSVENDPAVARPTGLVGSGRGLQGLGDRVRDLGGSLSAGPLAGGRWAVTAELPTAT
jgi:signal transduction histidine kinase